MTEVRALVTSTGLSFVAPLQKRDEMLSASVLSRHTLFSVAFTTNIAESNFRYIHVQ